MQETIRHKPQVGESQPGLSSTVLQIPLVNSLKAHDALLVVKNDQKVKFQQILVEIDLATQFQVASYEEVFGANKPKHGEKKKEIEKVDIRQFDVVLMDDTLRGKRNDKRSKLISPIKLRQDATKLTASLE